MDKLNNAILESFKAYKQYGARSSKKLIPLHTELANIIKDIFGDEYTYKYKSDDENTTEHKVSGKYYNKDVDITVLKDDKPVFCLGVKFVTSNYKQNANNYFENMMGETANLQANNIPYAQIIVLRDNAPYYKKNGDLTHYEVISQHHIEKYFKLSVDNAQPHRPIVICVHIVEIDDTKYTPKLMQIDFNTKFNDPATAQAVYNKTSLENMINEITAIKASIEM